MKTNDNEKIWTIGHGGNGRELPLELKRRFAWIFTSDHLPICIDNGAVIEIKHESENVYLKWRGIVFMLRSNIDIEILAKKMPYADVTVPKALPADCDWGFITSDTKDDIGFSALQAASIYNFKKVITFCDNSANFMLNEHSKIEVLAKEYVDNIENLRSRFDNLPVFVMFSLAGTKDPLILAERIKNSEYIKGISVKNDLPEYEKELPEKIIETMKDSGFKGSVYNKVFIGYRE